MTARNTCGPLVSLSAVCNHRLPGKGKGGGRAGDWREVGVGGRSLESDRIDQNQKESMITDRGDVVTGRDWLVWFIRSFSEEGPRFDSDSAVLSFFSKCVVCGHRLVTLLLAINGAFFLFIF